MAIDTAKVVKVAARNTD